MKENNEKLRVTFRRMFSLKDDAATHEEIRDRLLSGGKFTGTNMCVLVCAMVIASVGLNMGSTAVIIGAMLISPLMARTSPSFYDVLIAIFGGIAGIIGQTRQDKANNIIPGVAIATALMPPLCTCGYSIAGGHWRMLGGAAYLFLINAYFIFLSSAFILSVLRIPKVKELTESEWRKRRRRMIRNTILIIIPSIAAVYTMIR